MDQKMYYPAVFHKAEEGGFYITFPDFPDAVTEGDSMNEAYRMACDCLGLVICTRIEENKPLPFASSFDNFKTSENEFLVIIEFDMSAYKRRINSKSVKKTLTIPGWLNEEAIEKGINFSQVLQEALINKINSL